MQLGTRWSVGAEPPASLAPEVRDAIARVEAQVAHLDTGLWRWTLTWLERRPVVELDDGTRITVDASGVVRVADADDNATDDEVDH